MFIKKHLPMFIVLGFITVFAVVFSTAQAYGINQEISLVPDMSAPSGSVYVNVEYNCSDNSVTGLGIRVHFNSARLTYNGYDSFLSSGSLSAPQVQNDTENHDADISTDKFILLGYQDMNGNWPGQTLPAILARLKFTASGTGGSELRVSRVTNAAGFGFTGSGILLNLPSVTTSPAGSITQTDASSGGNVVSAGGASVVSRGVCWSTSQNPTISGSKTSDGSGTGSFSSTISGLLPNTNYYVRAYAASSLGTGYGSQVSFTTLQAASVPAVTTSTPGSITQTSANSGGNVTSDGGASVTSRGVCWSTSQNPTTAGSKTSNGSGTGIFSSSITGLSPGTSYYIRAYAVNSKGTGYGNQVSFTTSSSYTISGYVRSSANGYGISGVTMSFGSLGSVVTDNSGYYTKTVSSGWTGAITPSISGYTFNPGSRSYTSISSSLFNQDFSGTPAALSISGYVRNSSGAGVSGVSLSLSNSGGTAVTDTSGYYTKSVSYGWSGTVTPQKSGYTFTPADKSFSNVTANQSNQNFTANSTAKPNISVSPLSMIFNNSAGRSAQRSAEPVMETMEHDDFTPADGRYSTGLVIPEHVDEYWQTNTPSRKYRSRTSLPLQKDWSVYDTPVRNQGGCGSCWAFATVALLENMANRANLSINNDFAEQVLVSCTHGGQGCGGGWYWTAFNYIKQNGMPPENCYPYRANNGNCSSTCPTPDFKAKIESFTPAYGLWGKSNFNVDDLKGALQDGPLCVAMEVPDSFYSYRGGIYKYSGGYYKFGHAVLLVGYNDEQSYFKVKNSWGTSWGEGGYFRISYDDATSVVRFGSYALAASGISIEGDSGQVQEIAVSNTGTANLNVSSISSDKTWLNVSPSSFSSLEPGQKKIISVSVADWNQVFSPQDTAYITLASNDPDQPSVKIQVTAATSVMAERPVLMVSPPFYAQTSTDEGILTVNVGNSEGETWLDISNGGGGEMAWTASTSDSWLTISQGNSGTDSGRVSIAYSVNTGEPRIGTVTIASDSAYNSPQTVKIYQSEIDEDRDDDGMPDYYEFIYGFDYLNPDDGFGDADDDGLTNVREYEIGTNPVQKDSDGDCMDDGYEVENGTDPLVYDVTDFTLHDLILVLKILTDSGADDFCLKADADQNKKVEISDAVFIMQKIAGIR